jgi:hypothetical protein
MSSATEKWRPPIIGARNNVSNNSDHNGHCTDLGPTNVDGPERSFTTDPDAAAQPPQTGHSPHVRDRQPFEGLQRGTFLSLAAEATLI